MSDTTDTPLSFDTPDSSLVKGASYDPATRTLSVSLVQTNYTFSEVPASLWAEFEQATSKGRFFNERIRPLFPARKA